MKPQRNSSCYDDLLAMSRPVSARHLPMSNGKRAAQFASFVALVGYEDGVEEMARLTQPRIELEESAREVLDRQLCRLYRHIEEHPWVTLTYFLPDRLKDGGAYITVTEQVKKLDPLEGCVILGNGCVILFENLFQIQWGGKNVTHTL